jgi:hypothetical protein
MLGECLRDGKNGAAGPQHHSCGDAGLAASTSSSWARRVVAIAISPLAKASSAASPSKAISIRSVIWRRWIISIPTESAANICDRCIRQCSEPAVHTPLPVVGRPQDLTRRESTQIPQSQCQQPARPKSW